MPYTCLTALCVAVPSHLLHQQLGLLRLADAVRPFLTQSDLSVENGLFRLKPQSGFLTQSKKGFSTHFFLIENFDWRIQSKKSSFSTLQSKNSVENGLHVYFEPIASLIPPPNTNPHGHTATHSYQVPHCSIIQGADAGLAIPAVASLAASQRGAFLVLLASSVLLLLLLLFSH